jgi:hypothetical protein
MSPRELVIAIEGDVGPTVIAHVLFESLRIVTVIVTDVPGV